MFTCWCPNVAATHGQDNTPACTVQCGARTDPSLLLWATPAFPSVVARSAHRLHYGHHYYKRGHTVATQLCATCKPRAAALQVVSASYHGKPLYVTASLHIAAGMQGHLTDIAVCVCVCVCVCVGSTQRSRPAHQLQLLSSTRTRRCRRRVRQCKLDAAACGQHVLAVLGEAKFGNTR